MFKLEALKLLNTHLRGSKVVPNKEYGIVSQELFSENELTKTKQGIFMKPN